MAGLIGTNVALHDTALDIGPDIKHQVPGSGDVEVAPYFEGTGTAQLAYIGEDMPTDEELRILPRVPAKLKIGAYTIAFVELAERFSFYGTTVVYTNYLKNPRLRPAGQAPVVCLKIHDVL